MPKPSKHDDRGESLIELLVALAVMSTAVIALLGAMATAIRISGMHRNQTEAGAYIKEFAETLEQGIAARPTKYTACGMGVNLESYYEGFYAKPPAPYDRKVEAVRFWNAGTNRFQATCPSIDNGVQLVSLRVWSDVPGRPAVVETLDITLRKPCRPDEDPPCLG